MSIWGAAVKGRIFVTQEDPMFHVSASPGADTVTRTALQWAAGGPGTGLYVGADCGARNLDFLGVFGSFSSTSSNGDDVHILVPSHGSMVGSTDVSLSSWGSSYHGEITTIPADFVRVAQNGTGAAVIVARDKICGP
jgi:hypothetical protein